MNKPRIYETILKQADSLIDKELSEATNILNILALLKQERQLFWLGIYYAKPDKLVLGPYHGSLPCTKIQYGNGLCGQTASKAITHYSNDVSQLTNYIACHPETQSEIVIPGFKGNQLHFILDIDSEELDEFDKEDQYYLEHLAGTIADIDEKH